MESPRTILFLCPHNAAKSVLAAAYFDQRTSERGLPYRADSAGTEPDEQPAPSVVTALRDEGIDIAGHRPRLVSGEDLVSAHRVISLGCDVDDVPHSNVQIDRWDDVPPTSQDLAASRDAIKQHVDALVDELAGAGQRRATHD